MIPERWARYYLENAPSLVWLLVANVAAVLVGVRYYVETMPGVNTFVWPLYADSPAATFLAALVFATLLPNLGRRLDDAPVNRPLAYLHTLTFVWLVKYGLWTAVALNLRVSLYFPEVWAYFGIVVTHLAFVLQAYLLPHFGRTTRGALAFALGLSLLNDLVDYAFAPLTGSCALGTVGERCLLYPPLRYEPGLALPVLTVLTTLVSVWLASRAFDRLRPDEMVVSSVGDRS
ncbi:DUF1405 domain-containing protein [Halomarina ordinaria]|uniref:DUF1405 domain-containing protein n=1 Tax=Halomarina ordinaria TaxID=3033939 RepID=A0ABD5U4I9_9EURY|nr:DUF1405 domain-containing protein [Halomarina sp. PSRA2]